MPSALVTGAARGIGRSIVEHLASRGWDVIAGVRSEQDAAAVTAANPQHISSVISTSPTRDRSPRWTSHFRSGWTRSSTTRASW